MGLRKKFGTNTELENAGVWNQFDETFRVKIARTCATNLQYTKLVEQETKPYRRTMDLLSAEIQRGIMRRIYAKTIIKGWQTKVGNEWKDGIELDEGELLPVTVENIEKVLEALPDLFTAIQGFADEASTFRQVALEVEAKNL